MEEEKDKGKKAENVSRRDFLKSAGLVLGGGVAGLVAQERNDAHKLIEECMILANVEAARFLLKNSLLELKRLIHPQAIIPVRMNGKVVSQDIIFKVMAFFLIYIIIFIIGSTVMALMGLDASTAIGATAATLGNIGPGIGMVGPVDNFAGLNDPTKWVLMLLMLLGRLELFTILVLFTPYFWKAN